MRIWVTGAAGFLGRHLMEELRVRGHEVYGNDNFSCSMGRVRGVYSTDCCNYEGMLELFEDACPEVVIHCAALAHEGLSNFSPAFITDSIYGASVATFSAAIAAGVKRIVYMSSMARYGSQTLPFHEVQTPKPVDPYGIAKVASEDTLRILCRLHGVEYVIAVPHNIIGVRQKYDDPFRNVVSIMINRALQGKPLIVYGDGQQKRCFSPIADCLDSLVKMIDAPVSGEVINIGPDHGEMTILDMANLVLGLCGSKVGIEHVAGRPNEVKEAYCSSSKAKKLLGFAPKQSIYECVNEMVMYIRDNGVKEFQYKLPIEISKGCPTTWVNKLI